MADDNKIIVDLLVEGVDKFKADLKGGQDAVEKFTTEAKQGTTEAKQGFDQLGKSTESFKSQLKTMTSELIAANIQLAEMQDAGQQGTKEFTALEKKISDLTKKAGTLKDAIGDANQVISQAGSDTRGLDKAIRAVGTATAAFQVFEGAAVLAGKGNEDLQKALVKLNAVMAITQGLQQIQNELTRNDSVFKGMAAKATALYNVVVGQSTGALKLFRIALAGTGIGLAILAISELAKYWGLYGNTLDETKPKVDDMSDAKQRLLDLNKQEINSLNEELKLRIALGEITPKEADEARLLELKRQQAQAAINLGKAQREFNAEDAKQFTSLSDIIAQKKRLSELNQNVITAEQVWKETTIAYDEAKKSLDKYNTSATKTSTITEKKANAIEDYKNALENARKQFQNTFDPNNLTRYQTELDKLEQQIIELASAELLLGADPTQNQQIKFLREEYIKLYNVRKDNETILKSLIPDPQREGEGANKRIEIEKKINAAIEERVKTERKAAAEAPDRADQLVENAKRVQGIYEQVQSVISQTLDVVANASAIRSENEIRALEKKRERGLITEKQYEREVAKIKNEEARKNKIAQTIQAFAMIPMAILQALTSIPFPANIAAAAVVGALATAQAAIVAASPLPKFKQGGSVAKRLGLMRGKSHEQGGIPIEVEGNEYVMNQKAVRKYGVDFMDSINNLKLSPAVTMQAKLDNLNKTDYKLYEHLSTLGSYMKQDYRINENGNRILMGIHEAIKRNNTYV